MQNLTNKRIKKWHTCYKKNYNQFLIKKETTYTQDGNLIESKQMLIGVL